MEKNMNIRVIFILIVLFLNIQAVYGAENDYGIVQAWFNEKNATVEGLNLKIGEPATIIVNVSSKIDGNVYVMIREPGVTKAYNVLSGPSQQDDTIDNLNVKSGWSKTFTWTVSPNGAWKNGNAPINIFVQINKDWNKYKTIQFTIANPYILDEQYSGSTPVQTTGAAQPPPTGTTSAQKDTPFLGAAGALAVILGVWLWKRR